MFFYMYLLFLIYAQSGVDPARKRTRDDTAMVKGDAESLATTEVSISMMYRG